MQDYKPKLSSDAQLPEEKAPPQTCYLQQLRTNPLCQKLSSTQVCSPADASGHLNSQLLSSSASGHLLAQALPPKQTPGAKLGPKREGGQLDKTSGQLETATDSSEIDWDDKSRLEQQVLKQNFLEDLHSFDPKAYFGGMKVDDLADFEKDQRLSDMFKTFQQLQQQQLKKSRELARQALRHNPASHSSHHSSLKSGLSKHQQHQPMKSLKSMKNISILSQSTKSLSNASYKQTKHPEVKKG